MWTQQQNGNDRRKVNELEDTSMLVIKSDPWTETNWKKNEQRFRDLWDNKYKEA